MANGSKILCPVFKKQRIKLSLNVVWLIFSWSINGILEGTVYFQVLSNDDTEEALADMAKYTQGLLTADGEDIENLFVGMIFKWNFIMETLYK